ncbi:MAG: sulfotransferase domain-containing protein [Pontiellaceae bacterium]|nr:sulfotransferase domain-containing protein [Pontiellaceae bacterium]MBN2786350.1 sulfotransferase domain-containing protein [Pontiellaceae bacterium]
MKNSIGTVKYIRLQLLWRSKGFFAQFPSMRYPKCLFYIVSHERSGTHFLINSIQLNACVRRGRGIGMGAGWGRHNIGEWFGPYNQPEHRFDHIDAVNEKWSRLSSRAAIIKTHCDRALFNEKYIPAPIVYICRDPRDTLLSWYNYLNQDRLYRIHPYLEDHRCASFSEFIRRPASDFLKRNYSLSPAFDNVVERWAAHVSGWMKDGDPNVLTVRFRDLKADPLGVLNKVASFTGIRLKPDFLPAGLLGSESMLPQNGIRGAWKSTVSEADQSFIRTTSDRFGIDWASVADSD